VIKQDSKYVSSAAMNFCLVLASRSEKLRVVESNFQRFSRFSITYFTAFLGFTHIRRVTYGFQEISFQFTTALR
jgi:hypothetical protein